MSKPVSCNYLSLFFVFRGKRDHFYCYYRYLIITALTQQIIIITFHYPSYLINWRESSQAILRIKKGHMNFEAQKSVFLFILLRRFVQASSKSNLFNEPRLKQPILLRMLRTKAIGFWINQNEVTFARIMTVTVLYFPALKTLLSEFFAFVTSVFVSFPCIQNSHELKVNFDILI